MNIQPIEKRTDFSQDQSLDVHSIFYTIQGEGPFAGTPAIFVRLAGCNLQCPMCDTEYTTDRCVWRIEDIVSQLELMVAKHRALMTFVERRPLVVITGGEPFRQPLGPFIRLLLQSEFWIQIESNGTLNGPMDIEFNLDIAQRRGVYIVCSPKTPIINPHIKTNACCFKYVASYDEMSPIDGLPTRVLGNPTGNGVVARPRAGALVYLQPADAGGGLAGTPYPRARNEANLEAVKRSCLRHGYILQLQIHKLLGVE